MRTAVDILTAIAVIAVAAVLWTGRTVVRRPWIWPLYSVVAVAVGVGLLTSPGQYRPDIYRVHFRVVTPSQWGWGFLCVGILALGARFAPLWPPKMRGTEMCVARIVVACQAALYAAWAAGFAANVAVGGASINGPVIWGAAAVANTMSLWRDGTGRR